MWEEGGRECSDFLEILKGKTSLSIYACGSTLYTLHIIIYKYIIGFV